MGPESGASGRLRTLVLLIGLATSTRATECDCCPQEETGGLQLPLYMAIPVIILLVMLSGLFSGLTLGLMGLDIVGLEIVMKGGNQEMAKCARKIHPVRSRGNHLLCTLLLGNVAVNSALSILTADIPALGGLMGFLLSTGLIVLFGEILPQAACSRFALQIGARTVLITQALMYSPLYVLTKPLSMMLDVLLGKEVLTVYSRAELLEMLKLQIKLGGTNETDGEEAQKIAEGAMCFRDKLVSEVMTPIEDAYFLSADTRLGFQEIKEVFERGFSRVPVYRRDKNDYVGVLHTKDLMFADPEDEMLLGDFINIFNRKADTFFPGDKLPEVLKKFKTGGAHLGIVRRPIIESDVNPTYEIMGVITLEDIMEEILQDEIIDEHDVYVDVDKGIKIQGRQMKSEVPLGFFDPRWRKRLDTLTNEEVNAVKRHLGRGALGPGSKFELSMRACEWLVMSSRVENRVRKTSMQIAVPKQEDWLFQRGRESDRCILVLQGRLTALAGREQFRAEIGAFSVVGRESLASGVFTADFDAWLSTESTRLLVLKKELFQKAQELDKDPEALERAMAHLNKGVLDKSERSHHNSSYLGLSRSLACPVQLAICRGGVHSKGERADMDAESSSRYHWPANA
ncbi:unnamed protein product [Prorocentrum cordatum]|uniref:CNNM transmembrane domain-containing protein n=1 Tax=Prorocentrum cordatum TaxID=2364126 RepID=A0ABN9VNP6_9DINO|nr:unnamed protein product [Polarella glacialis]